MMSDTAREPKATIVVRQAFNSHLGGRSIGTASGQLFRENHVEKLLLKFERVVFDFRSIRIVASSFLDEAFGKLIYDPSTGSGRYTLGEFRARIEVLHDTEDVVQAAWNLMEKRQEERSKAEASR